MLYDERYQACCIMMIVLQCISKILNEQKLFVDHNIEIYGVSTHASDIMP